MSETKNHGEVPEGWELLTEGKAAVIYRHGESFYNPVQVVNRDMSVMMLRFYDDYRRERLDAMGEGRCRSPFVPCRAPCCRIHPRHSSTIAIVAVFACC